MRISDWSSDVCSSDLLDSAQNPATIIGAQESPGLEAFAALGLAAFHHLAAGIGGVVERAPAHGDGSIVDAVFVPGFRQVALFESHLLDMVGQALARQRREFAAEIEIGRATCRDRGCKYV